jgi:hypothetical protein
VLLQFLWREFATARVLVIVAVKLRIAVEAHRDRVGDAVITAFGRR